MFKTDGNIQKDRWCSRQILCGGINYSPVKQIVVKAEYSYRKFQAPYNDEPSINIGVVYSGMFTK
jgi:opacity protein-like surface antigen